MGGYTTDISNDKNKDSFLVSKTPCSQENARVIKWATSSSALGVWKPFLQDATAYQVNTSCLAHLPYQYP